MRRRARVAAAVAVGLWAMAPVAAAAAGGGGGGGAVCPGFASGQEVAMRDNCFAGTAQFVGPGEVVVRNDGRLDHTLTAVDGSFDTGIVRPGGVARLTLRTAGVFRVVCTLHGTAAGQGMTGLVVVGEPSAPEAQLASARGGGSSAPALAVLALAGVAATVVVARRSRRASRIGAAA